MLIRIIFILMTVQIASAQTADLSQSRSPLRLQGERPNWGCISLGESVPSSDSATSPMLRHLELVAGVFDTRSLNTLDQSLPDPTPLGEGFEIIGTLQLSRGKATKELSIARLSDGEFSILDSASSGQGYVIGEGTLKEIGVDLALMKGIERRTRRRSIRSYRMKHPYFKSSNVLDAPTVRSRIKLRYPPLNRQLDKERFRIRLPKSRSKDTPPGVLVWVSPSPNGQIPVSLHDACDKLNLIAIGVDNNGNTQPLMDRFQAHFDSLATVESYYRTDSRRVYITGMSGGGRCASVLQLAFPDVFMGAVPIVGLSSYERTPTGAPNEFWDSHVGRPSAPWFEMLSDRRIRAITGTMDFNGPEMKARTEQLKNDKINIRLDVINGMAHTMPSPEQFLDALVWVDELQQDRIDQAADNAQKALQGYLKRFGSGPAQDLNSRKVLIQITIDAPWSQAAWEAVEMLGIKE